MRGAHGLHRPRGHAFGAGRGHRTHRAIRIHIQQHGAARRAVLGCHIVHFGDHHAVQLGGGRQNAFQLLDPAAQVVAFGLQLDAAHPGQAAQPQIQDVLGLHLVQVEHGHQAALGHVRVIGGADHLDHLVDVHHRKQQALDQMQPLLRLRAAELAAAAHHHAAVVDPHLQHLLQSHRVRAAVHQRHVVHREVVLQRGVLEQLHQYRVRVEPGFDLDDDARAVMPVGQVDRARDAFELAVLDALGDAFQHALGAHHERQFGHHDRLLAGRDVLDMRGRTGGQRAAAGLVGLTNAVASDDDAAARPVRTRHVAHELLQRGVRMRHQMLGRIDDLAQVMRGHVRGHAHGDARAAVDQQVRDGGRQHGRLLELVVVVRREIDRVLVDVGVHAQRRGREPCLGVARGGWAVVERTEVAVAVHQRQTHRERLRQTHHRLVDRRIAVRVELAHHLADHAGRLHVRAVRVQVHLAHLVDDAALHRLHAVAGVGQGARVDHRVRVFEERLAHLLVQRRLDDMLLDRARVEGRLRRLAV